MIHRQILVVRGKKEGQWAEKDTFAFLRLERRAHPTSSFSESPPSNHAALSRYQV
ncbi:hypothetical protein [Aneurinibacillus migulanus]|uniref:hypothetical protein n=1 Tax=Aneurinibacillus migulanus TaxID=47500 RepID=UPI001F3719BD|nr:hypothetical protein [Aneurinibacillus migulanus]